MNYLVYISIAVSTLNTSRAYAENCISGYDLEGQRSDSSVQPLESFFYSWDESKVTLQGTPNPQMAMYLFVMPLQEYVTAVDWKYCPLSNTIQYNNVPLFTRSYKRVPHQSLIWVHYAPK